MQWLVVRGTSSLLLPPGGHALTGPRRRTWDGGRLVADVEVPATRTPHGWRFEGTAEVDVLVGPEPVAAPPLTVLGSFETLDLGRLLVGGQVLDTRLGVPSEQTGLQVWRIARHHGGAYWDGVAGVVAAWVRERLGQPHDELTHTRFVADGVLLLAALGEDRTDALEPLRAGDWFVHDSHDDGSDRVLNTHLISLLALRAAGYDDPRGVAELHRAVSRAGGPRSWAHGIDLLAGDVAAGFLPRHPVFTGHTHAAEVRAARQRHRDGSLVLPGGRTGRDVRDQPAPAYHTVNTADLASYAMATSDPLVRKASEAATRYALVSGHWRGLLRDRDPITLLVPSVLWRLGQRHQAERWAARLVAQGWAPALGWPGHLDRPWQLLPAGCL
ncbi:MAG: hypothetical protein JWO22_3992 [Frankiales bacterium]|nr:hypothetical protein [Frankiales bacterium]